MNKTTQTSTPAIITEEISETSVFGIDITTELY